MSSHTSNIRTYRKKKYINIGLIIFGIIFLYLIITIVLYLTAPRITPYEVREGSILKDNAYTGIAIRNEVVVNSDYGGYINYYTTDNSKVRAGTNIYTLSNEKLSFSNGSAEDNITLSEEQKNALSLKMQTFSESFKDASFSDMYLFKNELESSLQSISSQSKMDQLNSALNNGTLSDMNLYSTADDGIVVYSVDGMEGLTKDTVTLESLDQSNYRKIEFANNTKVNAGDPVYKLVTDESWTLVTEISKETYDSLKEKKSVKVRFTKDNQSLWGSLEMKEINGHILAYLGFDNSMIRYVNERYLDIEMILEDQSGLKIPKSAETEKDFYVVPKSYITQGGNSLEQGVLKQTTNKNGEQITEFLPVNIYYEEEESVYLDPNVFQKNDIIIKPESTETYTLRETKPLKGVYNINKGYAMFKQINVLCESEEYYIVEEGNSYGLSNYDRIALDSTGIKENDIVF